MKPSNKLIDIIKECEGYRGDAYQDVVGVCTIGYGTTRINGEKVTLGMTCTKEEAEQYIFDEVDPMAERVTAMVKVEINQNQFDALCDFCYNLGTGSLAGSTLLKKLNAGDYEGAANEFGKWNKAGGKELAGLTKRRALERDLFLQQP